MQQHRARWGAPAVNGFGRCHAGVNKLKGQLCGASKQAFHRFRVVNAGQLHQNPVKPLTLDHRLFGAVRVKPAANDLDGLLDRLGLHINDTGVVKSNAVNIIINSCAEVLPQIIKDRSSLHRINRVTQPDGHRIIAHI